MRTKTPGSHGLTFVPHLAGERSPGYAEDATGRISGLTLATTAEDVARAGVEAVMLEIARVNRLLDAVAPRAESLVASGNALLGSPAWMQLLANLTGTAVEAGRAREASSRGAAMFALEHLGLADPATLDPGAARTYSPGQASSTRRPRNRA